MRLGVIDRDTGFMQVVAKQLAGASWELRELSGPMSPDAIVGMRLTALVVDLAVVGPGGWEYLERLRVRLPPLVIVVCTGPSSVAQRVRGLRAGADAWLTKPCHSEELFAIVEAVLRRRRPHDDGAADVSTTVGELTIRPELHQAYAGETSVGLTAREFEILRLLCESDRVLSREEIYERVWRYAMAHGDRSVDVFVRKLRQKLRAASPHWNYIHTHFGVGYRLAAEPYVPSDAGGSPEAAQRGEAMSPATPVATAADVHNQVTRVFTAE